LLKKQGNTLRKDSILKIVQEECANYINFLLYRYVISDIVKFSLYTLSKNQQTKVLDLEKVVSTTIKKNGPKRW
jgi:hypothetical protein